MARAIGWQHRFDEAPHRRVLLSIAVALGIVLLALAALVWAHPGDLPRSPADVISAVSELLSAHSRPTAPPAAASR